MEIEKLIEALRTESRYKDKSTLEIMDLCMMAADKLEELNDFERSQCAKLLAKLAEKDKRLAAAVEDLEKHCRKCTHQIDNEFGCDCDGICDPTKWRGPQEAGEVTHADSKAD